MVGVESEARRLADSLREVSKLADAISSKVSESFSLPLLYFFITQCNFILDSTRISQLFIPLITLDMLFKVLAIL